MLLNITALTKTYTISGKLITALNTVDLTFSENSFTCIVGKSGCGKTTLLRLLSGLEPATSGTIDYGKAAKIGFVFQEPRLMPWLTVNANIAFAAKNDPSLPAAPDEKLLELLGLKAFQHSFPAQLSGGMAQRTALGRTLFQNPDLILMDEPSMGLSPLLVSEIFDIIKVINESGTTVLLVEQNAKKALSFADRAYVLETGKITLSGDAKDLINDESVKKAYLGE